MATEDDEDDVDDKDSEKELRGRCEYFSMLLLLVRDLNFGMSSFRPSSLIDC